MTVSAIRTDFDMNYVSDLFSRIQYSIKEEQIPFFYLGQMHMDEKEKLFLHGNTTHKQTDRQTDTRTQTKTTDKPVRFFSHMPEHGSTSYGLPCA